MSEEEAMWKRFRSALLEVMQHGVSQLPPDVGRVVLSEINAGRGATRIKHGPELALRYTALLGGELIGFEVVGPPGQLRLVEIGMEN